MTAELTKQERDFLALVALYLGPGAPITDELIKEAAQKAIDGQEKLFVKYWSMPNDAREELKAGLCARVYHLQRQQ